MSSGMAHFLELAGMVALAMVSVMAFGAPSPFIENLMVGAVTLWMLTFVCLSRKLDAVLRELRHARQMSRLRDDDHGRREAMSVVPLPKEEAEEETWKT